MDHIFICYTSKDEKKAKKITDYLRESGFQCWFAPDNMKQGNFSEQINKALEESTSLVYVHSCNVKAAKIVPEELAAFQKANDHIIPYKLDNSNYPDTVSIFLRTKSGISEQSLGETEALSRLRRYLEDTINVSDKTAETNKICSAPKTFGGLPEKVWFFLSILTLCIVGYWSMLRGSSNTALDETCPNKASLNTLIKDLNYRNVSLSHQKLDKLYNITCSLPSNDFKSHTWLSPDKHVYTVNDEIVIKGITEQTAYVAAYLHQADDTTILLYPNEHVTEVLPYLAEEQYKLGAQNESEFFFRIQEPVGIDILHLISTTSSSEYKAFLKKWHPDKSFNIKKNKTPQNRGVGAYSTKKQTSTLANNGARWHQSFIIIHSKK